jgi:hypothetical protein
MNIESNPSTGGAGRAAVGGRAGAPAVNFEFFQIFGARAAATASTAYTCPGRKPPFLVFKRPARPYKNAIQNRFT